MKSYNTNYVRAPPIQNLCAAFKLLEFLLYLAWICSKLVSSIEFGCLALWKWRNGIMEIIRNL